MTKSLDFSRTQILVEDDGEIRLFTRHTVTYWYHKQRNELEPFDEAECRRNWVSYTTYWQDRGYKQVGAWTLKEINK